MSLLLKISYNSWLYCCLACRHQSQSIQHSYLIHHTLKENFASYSLFMHNFLVKMECKFPSSFLDFVKCLLSMHYFSKGKTKPNKKVNFSITKRHNFCVRSNHPLDQLVLMLLSHHMQGEICHILHSMITVAGLIIFWLTTTVVQWTIPTAIKSIF